jgi:hypothetical protein
VFSWLLFIKIIVNKGKTNDNGIEENTITSSIKIFTGIIAVCLLVITGILFINESLILKGQAVATQVYKKGDKLLPIGSVILLEDSTKEVMIIGYCQNEIASNELWDYAGCLYPEGYLGSDKTFLFNSDQINKISCLGKETEEQQEFAAYVKQILKNERDKIK